MALVQTIDGMTDWDLEDLSKRSSACETDASEVRKDFHRKHAHPAMETDVESFERGKERERAGPPQG